MTQQWTESTEFLQQLASAARLDAQNTERKIWGLTDPDTDTATLKEPAFAHTVNKPNVGPPPKLSDVLDFGDTTDPTLKRLDTDAAAWLDKYFPSMNDCLRELPEDFLCGVLSGVKPFGLDQTVFEIVWHRARDRAYRTLASEQRQVEYDCSRRGFTLPDGTMAAAMAAARERASDAIAEVNREQAIKEAEIKFEMLKFCEEQALNYKLGILNALADFYKQWILLPNNDMERARIKAQAMSSLMSALSSYYNVEVAFEDLKLKAAEIKVDTALQVDRNRIANREANDPSGKAAALGQAARAFADIASQAAASAGSLVAQVETV